MNHVTICGNLTRDVELRYANNEKPMCTFGVAISKRTRDEHGQWVDGETSFFDVVQFGPPAEHLAETCRKGDRVFVSGRLEQRSWETPDGDKRSKIQIIAEASGPELKWNPIHADAVAKTQQRLDEEPF